MSVFATPAATLRGRRALFIHNWRCAGSTINSLLSSNFGDKYIKVGTQFTHNGWPDYAIPELLSIDKVRHKTDNCAILGGHICSGVESFFGGSWDVWVNARNPCDRLSSGILRFHANKFRLAAGAYTPQQAKALAHQRLIELIDGPLQHEANGMAKRLAGFAASEIIDLNSKSDLEKISCFVTRVSDDDLLRAALFQMERVKVVILSKYLHAALISIERMYSIGPVLNLFSSLRHNQMALGAPSDKEIALFELAKPMLNKISCIDFQLWEAFKIKFQSQINVAKVTKREVLTREVIHKRPILPPQVLDRQIADDKLVELISSSLAEVAAQHKELSRDIVTLACKWERFSPDAAAEIKCRALHILRLSPS